MRIIFNVLIVCLCFICGFQIGVVAAAGSARSSIWHNDANMSGTYANQDGSMLFLTCALETQGSALLSGNYFSNLGNRWGTYLFTGRATGCTHLDFGAFSVAWNNPVEGNSLSATSWTFEIYSNETVVMSAYWSMISYAPPKEQWKARNFGFDTFVKQH